MGDTSPAGRAGRPARPAEGFWSHRALICFAVVGAIAEAALLSALAPAARPLAPQVTALAPLAAFHDLRWLFGYHTSWLTFVAGLSAVLLGRSAVNSALVWLAWPHGVRKPRAAATLRSNLVLTALSVTLIAPVVAVVFGVALLPFSWPFLPALPAVILIAAPFSHGGVMASWWRTLPPLPAVGWVLADFAFLSAASAVIALLPAAGALPAAGLAGLVNARAWYGVTWAVSRRQARSEQRSQERGQPRIGEVSGARNGRRRPLPLQRTVLAPFARWAPVAPVAALMVLVLIAGATHEVFAAASGRSRSAGAADGTSDGTAAVTGRITTEPAGLAAEPPGPASPAPGVPGPGSGPPASPRISDPVLLIEGFGSPCCDQARGLQRVLRRQAQPGLIVQQFSYRGLDAAGNPIPHGRGASDLPLPLLGDRIAAQVQRLHRETGRPVDLVAESEGTLGVSALLGRHPGAPAGSVVLASPIVAPGQASYPVDDAARGDVASGYALRYVARFIGGLSPYGASGAVTLIDSVASVGARYQAAAARHPVRVLGVIPLADAVTLPACGLPANVAVVPGFHGGLLGRPAVQQMVRAFLAGQQVHGERDYSEASQLLAATGTGWRMPDIEQPSPPCPD